MEPDGTGWGKVNRKIPAGQDEQRTKRRKAKHWAGFMGHASYELKSF